MTSAPASGSTSIRAMPHVRSGSVASGSTTRPAWSGIPTATRSVTRSATRCSGRRPSATSGSISPTRTRRSKGSAGSSSGSCRRAGRRRRVRARIVRRHGPVRSSRDRSATHRDPCRPRAGPGPPARACVGQGHPSGGPRALRRRHRLPRSRDAAMTDPATVGGRRAVVEAIRAGRVRDILVAPGVRETQGLRAVVDAAAGAGVDVREADRSELDRLADDHQGVVGATARRRPPARARGVGPQHVPVRRRCVRRRPRRDHAPQNFGAAARCAEASGASVLVTRTRRAADATPAAIRASAGALLHLPLARVANIPRALGPPTGCGIHGRRSGRRRAGVDLRRAVSGGASCLSSAVKAQACRDWCASDATWWSRCRCTDGSAR